MDDNDKKNYRDMYPFTCPDLDVTDRMHFLVQIQVPSPK